MAAKVAIQEPNKSAWIPASAGMTKEGVMTKNWPKGIKTVSLENLDLLGVDEKYNLYWDGKPVETKIYLSRATKIGIFIGTILATLVSIKEILEFLKITNYHDLMGG